MAQPDLEIPTFDALDGLAPPHQQQLFFSHQEQEKALLSAWQSGKMHHAWLLTGPKGIGKATFAYRAARFIFDSGAAGEGFALIQPEDLAVSAESHAARQVANRAHPNLLSIERPYDPKGKKFRTEITVDEVRKTVRFFGSTAGEDTWRVCIVDPADDLNSNAANALLKILEEPPVKTVFFLISHAPGKLLPTIRSRCRRLNFSLLENPTLSKALMDLEIASSDSVEHLSQICEGSLRKAAELQSEDGLIMVHAFERLLAPPFKPDYESLHHFGDLVAQRGKDQNFAHFSDLVFRYLTHQLHEKRAGEAASNKSLMALADAWEKAGEVLRETQIFNLDKKQTAINVVRMLAEASRA
jgi:DNA polymerase-3 subunit delta'